MSKKTDHDDKYQNKKEYQDGLIFWLSNRFLMK